MTIQSITAFIQANLLWFTVGFLAAALILLALLIAVMVRQRKLRRRYNTFMQGKDGISLEGLCPDGD